MKFWRFIGFLTICVILLIPFGALADSISPLSLTIGGYHEGVSIVIHKTVTVSASSPTFSTEQYNMVSLDLAEVPAGLTATAIPASVIGSFDRSIERDFGFDLMFTLDLPGHYDFQIYGLVDSLRVATEQDVFDVMAPVPASFLLLGSGLIGLVGLRRVTKG